ncbi:MAG: hypothetical protein JJ975_16495 [Bacteroidia bacterium]|nr:hypothetical protein [Bacteroidia bacterium]
MAVSVLTLSACDGDEPTDDKPTGPLPTSFDETEIKDDDGNVTETVVTITDYGMGIGNTQLTKDKTWVLNGLVFVNSGQTLTVDAGTVVKGKSGQGENASALVVARGATIMAEGTASEPIIFTAEADKLDGNLPATARGLWGGLIVLGKAGLNSSPGESAIEGIPTSETRGLYGGDDDADNSGKLAYISIRHGGTDIGAGNEINGLTMGGVGTGTSVHHIEIVANNDDGVEFFGGTVNVKNIVISYCGDDNVDYDEGWRGKAQYIFVNQDPSAGDRGGEHDGGTDPEDGMPYATPMFYNCTYVGNGAKRAVTFRDNAGGEYHNSIFVNWDKGVDVEDLPGDGEDSKKRLDAGQLKWMNNIHWGVAGDDAAKQIVTASKEANLDGIDLLGGTNTSGNEVKDPMLVNGVPTADVAATGLSGDSFIEEVSYKGAIEPGKDAWFKGWTKTDQDGLVK